MAEPMLLIDELGRHECSMVMSTIRFTIHAVIAPKVVGKRLAPRLSTLDGKTIYLVDCLFDNADVFIEQLRQWFAEQLPP
jgi:hypothetical protein